MKYIITENQNEKLIIKYLNNEYGDLEEYKTDKEPVSLLFVKDKIVYMELRLRNQWLMVNYSTIWEDLKNIFGLEDDEIKRIIKQWVKETYNLEFVRPDFYSWMWWTWNGDTYELNNMSNPPGNFRER